MSEIKEGGEWTNKIEEWRMQDKKLLQMSVNEPNESESSLSVEEKNSRRLDRQMKFIKQVSESILNINDTNYIPSGKVISRAIEVLNNEDVASRIIKINEIQQQADGVEPLTSRSVQDALESQRAHASERRMLALGKAFEEQGNTELATRSLLNALRARASRTQTK